MTNSEQIKGDTRICANCKWWTQWAEVRDESGDMLEIGHCQAARQVDGNVYVPAYLGLTGWDFSCVLFQEPTHQLAERE